MKLRYNRSKQETWKSKAKIQAWDYLQQNPGQGQRSTAFLINIIWTKEVGYFLFNLKLANKVVFISRWKAEDSETYQYYWQFQKEKTAAEQKMKEKAFVHHPPRN